MKVKTSMGEKIADISLYIIMIIVCVIMLYPFLNCLAYSLSDTNQAMLKIVTIFPVGLTFKNYIAVLKSNTIMSASIVTVIRTVLGIVYGLFVTGLAAYAISKKHIWSNRAIAFILIVPMYVSGGLLPYYVLISKLNLFNNILVFILPNAFWAFNMLIMRSYFETIPASLEESAKLDGAGNFVSVKVCPEEGIATKGA